MPEIVFRDFSQGWCPSDDPINGRKNGLLRMDSLELDRNGAIQMSGGIKTIGSAYPAAAHSIYSIFLNGIRTRYVAIQNGNVSSVYRNTSALFSTSQTVTRTGFGAAYNFTLITNGNIRIKDDGASTTNLGLTTPASAPSLASAGAGTLTGDYEYIQIAVRNDGNGYIGKSAPSPISTITVSSEHVNITPTAPSVIDPQANQTWIYRRGNTLEHFYRVRVVFDGSTFTDGLGDGDALSIGEKLNLRVVPVSSTGITEHIVEIVGPVLQRHLYFTPSKVYFSEINSPDSTDPNIAINITGNSAEQFLWARKVAVNIVLVGTTQDVYILTGTFIQLPDGFLDVSFLPMGVSSPPISIDAALTSSPEAEKAGNIVYMANTGWVSLSPTGNLNLLSDSRVDRLYRGNTVSGYGGVPIYLFPQLRYSCCISKNKLWVRVPQIVNNDPNLPFTYRMECYDFKRQYWRPLPYSNTPSILFAEQDSNIMGFFPSDNTLKDIDHPFTKLNTLANQSIDLLTMYHDDGTPSNNKDALSLKIKANTFGSAITITAFKDGITTIPLGTINTSLLQDVFIDVIDTIQTFKTIEFRLQGASTDFVLNEIVLDYLLRPTSVVGHTLKANYGPNKKRARTWPISIDALGGTVTFTPYVDGVQLSSSQLIGTTGKRTHLHFFKTDVFGVDYEMLIRSVTPFEVWEIQAPDFVQILPIAKQFDQAGPIELFRYGKIKAFEVRIIAFGGTTIPYTIYFEDTIEDSGVITTVDSKETVQKIDVPKSTTGTALRLELGPTAFNFHIIDTRVQIVRSGHQTDGEWVPLSKLMQPQ